MYTSGSVQRLLAKTTGNVSCIQKLGVITHHPDIFHNLLCLMTTTSQTHPSTRRPQIYHHIHTSLHPRAPNNNTSDSPDPKSPSPATTTNITSTMSNTQSAANDKLWILAKWKSLAYDRKGAWVGLKTLKVRLIQERFGTQKPGDKQEFAFRTLINDLWDQDLINKKSLPSSTASSSATPSSSAPASSSSSLPSLPSSLPSSQPTAKAKKVSTTKLSPPSITPQQPSKTSTTAQSSPETKKLDLKPATKASSTPSPAHQQQRQQPALSSSAVKPAPQAKVPPAPEKKPAVAATQLSAVVNTAHWQSSASQQQQKHQPAVSAPKIAAIQPSVAPQANAGFFDFSAFAKAFTETTASSHLRPTSKPACHQPGRPPTLADQTCLLDVNDSSDDDNEDSFEDKEIKHSILFSGEMFAEESWERTSNLVGQYALLGNMIKRQRTAKQLEDGDFGMSKSTVNEDKRVFLNTNIPASFFVCGVQGSGKSHTLSCLLENYLIQAPSLGRLHKPLSAIVFHFGQYNSKHSFRPCEAAFLACPDPTFPHSSLHHTPRVTVLVSPSNYHNLKASYSEIPNVNVKPLRLHPSDLTIQSMLTLMAIDQSESAPLYMSHVTRILREMAESSGAAFEYFEFKKRVENMKLEALQKRMLQQRLELLESFLESDPGELKKGGVLNGGGGIEESKGKEDPRKGELTIVDLSCPFVDESTACVFFNICISLYLSNSRQGEGKIIAMDEAHKYMSNPTPASKTLTDHLLSVIRQQRHYGVRVIIATQEPTISPRLMDLASATVIHRFTSPEWFRTLRKHIAVFDKREGGGANEGGEEVWGSAGLQLFKRITNLKVGQALVYAPTALVGNRVEEGRVIAGGGVGLGGVGVRKMNAECFEMKMRKRITLDGGKSIVCV